MLLLSGDKNPSSPLSLQESNGHPEEKNEAPREREKKVQIAQFERKLFFPPILYGMEMGFNKKGLLGRKGCALPYF